MGDYKTRCVIPGSQSNSEFKYLAENNKQLTLKGMAYLPPLRGGGCLIASGGGREKNVSFLTPPLPKPTKPAGEAPLSWRPR